MKQMLTLMKWNIVILLSALALCGCDPEPFMPSKPTGQYVEKRVTWIVAARNSYSEPNLLGPGYSPSYYLIYTNESGAARQMSVGVQRWMNSPIGSIRTETEWVWREPR